MSPVGGLTGERRELSEEVQTFYLGLVLWILEVCLLLKMVHLIFVYFNVCTFYLRERTAKMVTTWELGMDRNTDNRQQNTDNGSRGEIDCWGSPHCSLYFFMHSVFSTVKVKNNLKKEKKHKFFFEGKQ